MTCPSNDDPWNRWRVPSTDNKIPVKAGQSFGEAIYTVPQVPDSVLQEFEKPAKGSPSAYPWYVKDVSKLQTVDIYRILELYKVTNPCIQHAIKKLLCAGERAGGKDFRQDLAEARDALARAYEMLQEDEM